MEKLINYLNKLWLDTISPTIKNSWNKSKENSDRIVNAINNKKDIRDITVDNLSEISDPIVEAQQRTTEAVKAIPMVEIPETDLKPLEMKLEALLSELKNKEMSVKIGKTQVDTKSVVKAIEKLQESMPKMENQEVVDYTMMLDEMMKILERPKDHSEMIKLQELVKRLGTSNDLSIIAEWLKVISEKEYPELPAFKFNKYGRLEVEVDRAGGGGGLTDIETDALTGINDKVSTEAKQDTLIAKFTNDEFTNALLSCCMSEYDVNRGVRYKVNDPVELGDTETREWLITTPNTTNWAHVNFVFVGDFAGRAQLFENTTKTGGTPLTASNRNRNSSNTATVTVAHTPGGSGDGTPGPDEYFGGGKFGGGGQVESSSPLILKQNTKYLLRITSDAVSNRINIIMWWSEYANI